MALAHGSRFPRSFFVFLLFLLLPQLLLALPVALDSKTSGGSGRGAKYRVLLLAEGRSGSSVTLDILSQLPDAYVLFEPFRNFVKPNIGKFGTLRYSQLFDCSFLRSEVTTNGVYWPESCRRQASSRFMSAGMRERCAAGVLSEEDRALMHAHCRRSQFVVIKEIRFRESATELPPVGGNFRLVMLFRHPASVAESQARLGWFSGNGPVLAKHICDSLKSKLPLLKRPDTLILHQEAILASPQQVCNKKIG